MTDQDKLEKLEEAEQKAWEGDWMKWYENGKDVNDQLEVIERCQRIRTGLYGLISHDSTCECLICR